PHSSSFYFSFNHTSPTETSTLSLHDALPIYGLCLGVCPKDSEPADNFLRLCKGAIGHRHLPARVAHPRAKCAGQAAFGRQQPAGDRKSTRLNSSHVAISYAVFCLKKKIHKIA